MEFAINSAKQDGTQHSTAFPVTGHEPAFGVAFLNPNRLENQSRTVEQFLLGRENAIAAAKDYLAKAQDYMAAYANRSRQDTTFKIGDQVMVHAGNMRSDFDRGRPSAKLSDVWYGPYRVEKVVSSVAYKVHLPKTLKVHNVFHISKLKKYCERTDSASQEHPSPNDPASITQPTDDDIEEVLDTRAIGRNKSQIQYLIQLQGQLPQEAKWYNKSDCLNCKASLPDELSTFF